MGNGVLALNLFQTSQVMWVSLSVRLQDEVVDSTRKLSTDHLGKHLPLGLELRLNWDSIQNLLVKAVDFADLQGQGKGNFFLILFDEFVDYSGNVLVVSLDLQDLQQVQVLRWLANCIKHRLQELGIFSVTIVRILFLNSTSRLIR